MKISEISKSHFDLYSFELAALHKNNYPSNHLTTRLPLVLLQHLYIILSKYSVSIIMAFDDNHKVLGFLLCGKYPKQILIKLFLKAPLSCLFFLFESMGFILPKLNKILSKKRKFNSIYSLRLISIVSNQKIKKGIGKKLELYMNKNLKKKGYKDIGLSVKESNKKAIKFYNNLGYKMESRQKGIIYMYKIL